MTTPRQRGELRPGFTTGTCAAAAAKGAVLALLGQAPVAEVEVRLPAGTRVAFRLHACSWTADEGRASVIKDAGDDPDVTHGAEVRARVWLTEAPGVAFHRGPGVGLVTKKGLPVPPGEPAINPVPRAMIAEAVREALAAAGRDDGRGVAVEVSIPNGEELAQRTFNPRLGIVGGLSILGTTGIVTPYSTAAWRASVLQGIDVAAAQGCTHLVLAVGAQGERFARALFPDLPGDAFQQVGTFFGDALRHCAAAEGVARVTLAAMIGKLAKFAAGHESVHSTQGTQDFDFLAEVVAAAGGDAELQGRARRANTAQEVAELAIEAGLHPAFGLLCERAWQFGTSLTRGAYPLEIVLTGRHGEVLGKYPD